MTKQDKENLDIILELKTKLEAEVLELEEELEREPEKSKHRSIKAKITKIKKRIGYIRDVIPY